MLGMRQVLQAGWWLEFHLRCLLCHPWGPSTTIESTFSGRQLAKWRKDRSNRDLGLRTWLIYESRARHFVEWFQLLLQFIMLRVSHKYVILGLGRELSGKSACHTSKGTPVGISSMHVKAWVHYASITTPVLGGGWEDSWCWESGRRRRTAGSGKVKGRTPGAWWPASLVKRELQVQWQAQYFLF